MVRKIVVALLFLSGVAGAQSISGSGNAISFNNWRAAGSVNLAAGANTFVAVSPCQQAAAGTNFPALAASTPIKIWDPGNPAIDEVITPTAVVAGSTCTATFTTTNAHPTPWYITSGTEGLQEAINSLASSGVLNEITVGASWHAVGGSASTIWGAAGSPYLTIADTSINPDATWRWNGTHYVPNFALLGNVSGTPPTIAAGAAAGTAPTISNNAGSSGNVMTANVTTGTATTTGTLFTETVGTPSVAGNINCVVKSVGVNTPPAFTWTSASASILTVTMASAPPTATAYIFGITCD